LGFVGTFFWGVTKAHLEKLYKQGQIQKRKQVWPLGDLGAPGWADSSCHAVPVRTCDGVMDN